MHDRADHGIEHLVENPFMGQHRADRYVAAGERLGEQHHVGLDAPVLARKKPARATKSRLDFISDEQGSVFSAELECSWQIAIVRKDDALSLNRLDKESCDRARSQRLLQRSKIVEGNLDTVRQKRTEARAEILVAVQRQRTIGQTVKGVTAINNAAAAGRRAGKFDSRFNGLCAGIGKEDLVEIRHKFEQALGQNT